MLGIKHFQKKQLYIYLPWNLAQTLEFTYILNAGTIHEGPHVLISLFSPPYILFLANVFLKLEFTLIWPREVYSMQSLNGKGDFDFWGGHTNKIIQARFFYYGLSRMRTLESGGIWDSCKALRGSMYLPNRRQAMRGSAFLPEVEESDWLNYCLKYIMNLHGQTQQKWT